MAADQHPDVLLVRKHLVEHLGQPDEVFEISGSPIPNSPVQSLNLAYFAPGGPHSPVVFATCGASLYRMADGRRVEGLIILRREPNGVGFEGVNKLLGSFALFAESTGQAVRIGDVVRAPTELKQFCQMDAVLFLPPVPFVPQFHQLPVTRNEQVDLIWLLPVYEEEAEYALKNGPQALMLLFAAQGLDLTDPERSEANTLVRPEDAADMARRVAEDNAKKGPDAVKPTILPAGKTKTSRRDMGRGSFDVEEGESVVISRRSKPTKAARSDTPGADPPPAATQVEVQATPTQAQATATQVQVPAPPKQDQKRRPWVVQPEAKNEVRFDLTATQVKVQRKVEPEKAEKPAPEPPESAKKRRFEELKAAAKAAEVRATARRAGQIQAEPEGRPAANAPQRSDSSARAAARRRGAPTTAIQGQLKGKRGE
ncbi:MAG: suppressor of fused domain protein [Deltaproteobacteria bacterium]|nr:suppressor of fused domain protein [Deltaproteobacteria bacterium]